MLSLPFLSLCFRKKEPLLLFFCLDQVYTDIGKFLKFYKSGPIPKAFKAAKSKPGK